MKRVLVSLLFLLGLSSPASATGAFMNDDFFDCGVQIINNTKFQYPLVLLTDDTVTRGTITSLIADNGQGYQMGKPFRALLCTVRYAITPQIKNSVVLTAEEEKSPSPYLYRKLKIHSLLQKDLNEKYGDGPDTIMLSNGRTGDDLAQVTFTFGLEGQQGFPSASLNVSKNIYIQVGGVSYGLVPQVSYTLWGE